MALSRDQKLLQLRNALPPHIKQRADFIVRQIVQIKGKRAPTAANYGPLRQLPSVFPNMTGKQLGVIAFYIVCEAGLVEERSDGTQAQQANQARVTAMVQQCLDTIKQANDEQSDAKQAFSASILAPTSLQLPWDIIDGMRK